MSLSMTILRGAVELNRIRRLNGIGAALRFGVKWGMGSGGTTQLNVHGTRITLRFRYADWKAAYNSLGNEFDVIVKNFAPCQDALIIDAGGFIGTAAIRLAKAYPDAKIICLEPSLANFEILKQNVSGFSNIEPMQFALATSRGTALLKRRETGDWGHTLVDCVSAGDGENVATTTLGDILERVRQERVFLMKMDIEGSEDELLRGPNPWLERTDILFIELHERIVPGVTERFRAATTARLNLVLEGEKILSLRMKTEAQEAALDSGG